MNLKTEARPLLSMWRGNREVRPNNMKRSITIVGVLFLSLMCNAQPWSAEKANAWYKKQGWLVGCNFLPSSAINQLEMWEAQSFDTATINRELGWAEAIGFNTLRVFLHNLVWEN